MGRVSPGRLAGQVCSMPATGRGPITLSRIAEVILSATVHSTKSELLLYRARLCAGEREERRRGIVGQVQLRMDWRWGTGLFVATDELVSELDEETVTKRRVVADLPRSTLINAPVWLARLPVRPRSQHPTGQARDVADRAAGGSKTPPRPPPPHSSYWPSGQAKHPQRL